jgi:hypothetical protein
MDHPRLAAWDSPNPVERIHSLLDSSLQPHAGACCRPSTGTSYSRTARTSQRPTRMTEGLPEPGSAGVASWTQAYRVGA